MSEWSDLMEVAEVADELDTTIGTIRKTAARRGTYCGFAIERVEIGRHPNGHKKWAYRFQFVGDDRNAG